MSFRMTRNWSCCDLIGIFISLAKKFTTLISSENFPMQRKIETINGFYCALERLLDRKTCWGSQEGSTAVTPLISVAFSVTRDSE